MNLEGHPLDGGVSKDTRRPRSNCQSPQTAGSVCRFHDSGSQSLHTRHLHRQGRLAEEQQARERLWHHKMLDDRIAAMTNVDTRVDLTLKACVLAPASDLQKFLTEVDQYRKRHGASHQKSHLVTASGEIVRTRVQDDPDASAGPRSVSFRRITTPVTEDLIYRDVHRMMNCLNQAVFRLPRRKRKGSPRLDTLIFQEYGPFGHRPHLHALIERPAFLKPYEFRTLVAAAWRKQDVANREMRSETIRNREACLVYNAKAPDAWYQVVYEHMEPDERARWRFAPAAEGRRAY